MDLSVGQLIKKGNKNESSKNKNANMNVWCE